MTCEFVYCLYYNNNKCSLPETAFEIDSIGCCANCIIMQLDTAFLDRERARQLREMNSDD